LPRRPGIAGPIEVSRRTSNVADDASAGPPQQDGTSAWTVALDALAGGATEAVARFRFDVTAGTWWWSAEMFHLHGFAPADVVPSTELMLRHKHPDDRARTAGRLASVLATGEPFCCRHRIIDAAGDVRTVLSLGEGTVDESGVVTVVRGYFIDLTESLRHTIDHETREAVERAAMTRASIEQAKGILIAVFGIDDDAAFALLRWHSSRANIKLRLLAAELVRRFTEGDPDAMAPRRRVSTFFAALSQGASSPSASPAPRDLNGTAATRSTAPRMTPLPRPTMP
jgi:hypothetical protein